MTFKIRIRDMGESIHTQMVCALDNFTEFIYDIYFKVSYRTCWKHQNLEKISRFEYNANVSICAE